MKPGAPWIPMAYPPDAKAQVIYARFGDDGLESAAVGHWSFPRDKQATHWMYAVAAKRPVADLHEYIQTQADHLHKLADQAHEKAQEIDGLKAKIDRLAWELDLMTISRDAVLCHAGYAHRRFARKKERMKAMHLEIEALKLKLSEGTIN